MKMFSFWQLGTVELINLPFWYLFKPQIRAGGICVRLGDNCVKVKRGGVELRAKNKGTHLPTMYPPMEHLSNDHEDRANQHENSHKLMQWSGSSCCEFDGKSMEMRKHHDQNSQWSESYCRTNTSIRRNK